MPTKNDLFVDTSGWTCYVDRDDTRQPKFVDAVKRVVQRRHRLITTNYIIAELASVLQARLHLTRDRVVSIIEIIKTNPHLTLIHIDEATDDAAWAMYKQYRDKEWSLVDVSSFVVMRQTGLTEALTTDHHFEQAGFVVVPAVS